MARGAGSVCEDPLRSDERHVAVIGEENLEAVEVGLQLTVRRHSQARRASTRRSPRASGVCSLIRRTASEVIRNHIWLPSGASSAPNQRVCRLGSPWPVG